MPRAPHLFPHIAEEIEKVHRKFIKFALGLPSTAANLAIYGETDRTPLDSRRNVLMVKYWLRLTTDWEVSPYLREAHLDSFKDSPWTTHIKKVLEGAGYAEIWVNPNIADQHTSQLSNKGFKISTHRHGKVN